MVLRFEDLVQPVARGEAGVHQVEELATEVRRHTVAPGWVEPDDVFPASPPPPWRRLRRLVDQLVGVAAPLQRLLVRASGSIEQSFT